MELKKIEVDIKTDDEIGVIVQYVIGYDEKGNVIEQDYSRYEGNEYLDWEECQSELAEELEIDKEDVCQGTVEPLLAYVEVNFVARENIEGVVTILSVIGYDSDGNEIRDYQEYVDNVDYNTEVDSWWERIQRRLASDLGIDSDDVRRGEDDEFVKTPWDN